MKPIQITFRDGKLIFKDYAKREVSIWEKNYLKLMENPEKYDCRHALEECLNDPHEVWIDQIEIKEEKATLYKYFKFYNQGVFLVFVLVDGLADFHLNNWFYFENDRLTEEGHLRKGIPAVSSGNAHNEK